MRRLLLASLPFVVSCSERPAPVPSTEAGPTWALSVDVPFAELTIPPDSREGTSPPDEIALQGPWTWSGAGFVTDLPVRPRAMFTFRPPAGMVVLDASGSEIAHGDGKNQWRFDLDTLTVHTEERPAPGALRLRYPFATEREKALNHAFSGVADPAEFVRTRAQAGPWSRAGLLLPAPGVAAWDIEIPKAAELQFSPGLIAPEAADGRASDGATFVVEIEVDGKLHPLWSEHLTEARFSPVRLDLSKWSGQRARLRFRTEPGASSRFDYAFFAEPVVAPRKKDPRRVVMLFVDTLRPDHLGLYGYQRDTSKPLDDWARSAVVFDDARSVAPWTLPSARSLVTGRQPERYGEASTLQGRLRAEGWATAMFAGNVYLSANFEMERDWGAHHDVLWPSAEEQVDRAVDWLAQQDGRDALLLVHFMDAHLPYHEPPTYRYRYASLTPPARLGERFERGHVVRTKPKAEERQYIQDRYDNNVAYLHDEIGRLLASLREDDIVVYFADHGEEFWDHREFEHGHSLYDELLRVPLVIRAPGLRPGRVDEPASLLDVTPTLLELLGLSGDGLDGTSLLAVARGDGEAQTALDQRVLAFGRPLYGPERWGAVLGDQKYTTSEGRENLYDLGADPRERTNLFESGTVERAPWRGHLATGLGRPVREGLRLATSRAANMPREDLIVEVTVPGGIEAAWVGEDPTDKSAAEVTISGDVLRARWLAGRMGPREVFFVPKAPIEQVLPVLGLQALGVGPIAVAADRKSAAPGTRSNLARFNAGGRQVSLTFAIEPEPLEGATPLDAADAELKQALEAIGYVFDGP